MNYDISLYDLEYQGDFNYKGLVKIDLEIKRSTKDIVVNAHHLNIHHVGLSVEGAKCEDIT